MRHRRGRLRRCRPPLAAFRDIDRGRWRSPPSRHAVTLLSPLTIEVIRGTDVLREVRAEKASPLATTRREGGLYFPYPIRRHTHPAAVLHERFLT